jgi:hypothetical protein
VSEHVGAQAVLATLGFMATRETKVDQGVEVGVCDGEHMAATSAVATIGATELFVLFVPKRNATVPAITCGDVDIGFVYKFHGLKFNKVR